MHAPLSPNTHIWHSCSSSREVHFTWWDQTGVQKHACIMLLLNNAESVPCPGACSGCLLCADAALLLLVCGRSVAAVD